MDRGQGARRSMLSGEFIIKESDLTILLQAMFVMGYSTARSLPDLDYQKEGYDAAVKRIAQMKEEKGGAWG